MFSDNSRNDNNPWGQLGYAGGGGASSDANASATSPQPQGGLLGFVTGYDSPSLGHFKNRGAMMDAFNEKIRQDNLRSHIADMFDQERRRQAADPNARLMNPTINPAALSRSAIPGQSFVPGGLDSQYAKFWNTPGAMGNFVHAPLPTHDVWGSLFDPNYHRQDTTPPRPGRRY